jgi:hypothetical protein
MLAIIIIEQPTQIAMNHTRNCVRIFICLSERPPNSTCRGELRKGLAVTPRAARSGIIEIRWLLYGTLKAGRKGWQSLKRKAAT